MKTRFLGSFLVFLLLAAPAAGEMVRKAETEHLILEWVDGTPQEAIDAVRSEGEKYHSALKEMLGHEPAAKITILLQGPAERPDGSRGYPRVDSFARIHLYQFDSTWHSYLSPLAHEMVHVFRFRRETQPDWFFEEGFAEFVALRVDSSLAGFPWYGFPVAIAAGQWLARGEDIPLVTLRNEHRSLNQPCKAQSYALRSDFFDFLGRTFGDDTVLAMASQERAGDPARYREHFGADFETLESQWRKDLLMRYDSFEDAGDQARSYRESPIRYMHVCTKGREF